MDFSSAGSLRGGGEYIETVRALHQTVVSLRTALERSRTEILQLKTRAWPVENLESAVTALSLENHVLRRKILDLNAADTPRKLEGIAGRLRSVTSSLENLTTKSQRKSSQLSGLPSRTKSFHSLHGTEDHEPVFASTPLHSNQLPAYIEAYLDLSKIPIYTREHGDEILDNNTNKEAKLETTIKDTKTVEDTEYKQLETFDDNTFDTKKQLKLDETFNKKKQLETLKGQKHLEPFRQNEYLETFNKKKQLAFEDENQLEALDDNERFQTFPGKKQLEENKPSQRLEERKFVDKEHLQTFGKGEEQPFEEGKQLEIFPENRESQIFPLEVLDPNKEKKKFVDEKHLQTFGKEKEQSFEEGKQLGIFPENRESHIFPLEILDHNKEKKKFVDKKHLQTFGKEEEQPFEEEKQLEIFPENKESQIFPLEILDHNKENVTENKGEQGNILINNLTELKKPQFEEIGTKRVTINESNESPITNIINKQTDSQSTRARDKRDKKISVSVNLEIYRKPLFKMEPEKNILQHSSSTDLLDQEVDDIELIFTNEDTKETNLKEPLISIDGNNRGQPADFDQNVSADVSDRELDDDVFNDNFENENQENINFQSQTFDFTRENSQTYNSKSDNSINQDEVKSLKSYYSYQDSSFENKSLEKDESFDRFDERVRIVETDMSKVGIQDVEYSMGRRNTCPNPIQYRPIAHREAIGRGYSTRKTRPILAHSNAMRKESGAQTDISALPNKSSWRSESSLAHKVKIGDNFTTLPSKYPLPGSRLRLSEKTVESRRILLSDIGFTSMVPELSRSADHLCPTNLKAPSVTNYGQFLKTTDLYSPGYTSQRFMWTNTSPSESHSQSRYSSLYPLASPPAPSRRCSAPVSPCRRNVVKHVPSKVRFANGSLPELRGDWNSTIDSGDSTDSLVEEAEQYLRRSIDCIVGGKDVTPHGTTKTSLRRSSAPEPARDNIPPQGWQPFLPRLPRDLRLDYWVKVISPEGRVRGGRVRFVGDLVSHSEQFIGVQLSMPDGHSDGTHNNRRYFQCEPYHGIFVPFKKVIMGWKP